MKKFILCLSLTLPLFFFSCSSDDDENETVDIDSIEGTWESTSVSGNVTSSNTLATIALNLALQQYASRQEPAAYVFYSDNTYESYIAQNESYVYNDEGEYTLTTDSLIINSTNSGTREAYKLVAANSTAIKIKKNYLTDTSSWALDILSGYVGVEITEATATMTYQRESSN